MQIDKYRLEGGGSCPEQYDVFDGDKKVGYLRLRHGYFRAECYDDEGHAVEVYAADTRGDGHFEDDERDEYLTAAVHAIDKFLRRHEIGTDITTSVTDTPMPGMSVTRRMVEEIDIKCHMKDKGAALAILSDDARWFIRRSGPLGLGDMRFDTDRFHLIALRLDP